MIMEDKNIQAGYSCHNLQPACPLGSLTRLTVNYYDRVFQGKSQYRIAVSVEGKGLEPLVY